MKYLLCGWLAITFVLEGQAQTYQRTQEYCEFVVEPLLISDKCHARVDYGQTRSRGLFQDVDKLRNPQTQEAMEFNSAIDVLHYMNEQGWELVQVYVADSSDERYLLRRPLLPTSPQESDVP